MRVIGNEYAAQAEDVGVEWVRVAARAFPGLLTVSKAKRERKRGALVLNGERLVATCVRLTPGDRIQYQRPEATTSTSGASEKLIEQRRKCFAVCVSQGLRVVYESEALAVVVKPAGIHVKGRGMRTVENALPLLLSSPKSASASLGAIAPRAVHRLDARVGGLLLVAKTREAETSLTAQFEAHQVVKQYRAIMVGKVDLTALADAAPPSHRFSRLPADRVYFVSAPIGGKLSWTAMRVVSCSRSERYEWLTTVDLWPRTGRKHQLRLHMAHIGHPIAGDDLYHDLNPSDLHEHDDEEEVVASDQEEESDKAKDVVRGRGLFLYATGISFADLHGNQRGFFIDEPHKFARFRHFCAYNWEKRASAATSEAHG